MKTWFSIKAKADNTAEISIFDEIGMWGVTAKDFIAELKKITAKQITLSINSPGGSVFDALAMYNALRSTGAEITGRVMGIAASAASLILMAADKRVMPANSFLMVHNPIGGAYGNAEDMREIADILDKIGASLVSTYVARTGKTEDEVRALLAAETWMTAAEAVELGFADEVEEALKIAATFDTDRLPDNIKAVFKAQDGEAGEAGEAGGKPADEGAAGDGSEGGDTDANAAPPADEKPKDTFAEQVAALSVTMGLSDFLGTFVLDASIKTVEQARAAMEQAREVRALCDVAKLPNMAAGLIRERKTLDEARAALFDTLAQADEQTHTSNQQRPSNPLTATGAAVWNKIFPPANRQQ